MNILILEPNNYDTRALKIFHEIGNIFYPQQEFSSKDINCLVVRINTYIGKSYLNKYPALKFILSPTTALTHIDIDLVNEKKIKLLSLRDCKKELINITSSAEHALLLTLLLSRNIHNFNDKNTKEWNRYKFKVRQVSSLKIGIIGLGRIGSWLKRVLEEMGVSVFFNDTKNDLMRNIAYRSKKELLEDCDVIILSCTYNSGDKEIIGFEEVNYAKDNQLIVNISRGGVINEEALLKGLLSKKIKGYATDVISQEDNSKISDCKLIDLQQKGYNVIITPHIGGVAYEAMRETEFILASKFKEFIKNG
tara:strand:- start:704 stop:1624 length:921 start_codon:yes stop_codon:yes gene_type:complete